MVSDPGVSRKKGECNSSNRTQPKDKQSAAQLFITTLRVIDWICRTGLSSGDSTFCLFSGAPLGLRPRLSKVLLMPRKQPPWCPPPRPPCRPLSSTTSPLPQRPHTGQRQPHTTTDH